MGKGRQSSLLTAVQILSIKIQDLRMSLDERNARSVVQNWRRNTTQSPATRRYLTKYVHWHARKLLGVPSNLSPEEWPLADCDQVLQFNSTGTNSPESKSEILLMDWEDNGLSPWMKQVAKIFEARFLTEHRNGSFPLEDRTIPPGEVASIFIRFVLYLKKVYKRGPNPGPRRRRQSIDGGLSISSDAS
ncbi:hypothetical protein FRC14_002305 [Serendipita sp. 396]|nr:hypothetical protein FRC14_002305 [Serendipita sp. 396]KAG8784792.1 hypothetical protein FRC15_002607 [Serendipita sp. 397]KAG8823729.1 hypothetical protein FRC19_003286 [Serendipita sp. 401]